ncbi:hypothetical protein KAR10_00490 [bacterium]|nr:hypothetical protein [bacterium]
MKTILPGFHPLSYEVAGVLLVLLEKFVIEPGWYRREVIRVLVLEYYQALRQVLRRSSRTKRWLTRCCHCGIFF